MKVLWIADNAFPGVYEALGKTAPVNAGWVHAAAHRLIFTCKDVVLSTAAIMDVPKMQIMAQNGIHHYVLPKSAESNGALWKELLDACCPEVIHVHGTEYPYLYTFMKARTNEKVVLSIQGLVSVIERYYLGAIPALDLVRHTTLRDIIRWDSLFHQQKKMRQRSVMEVKAVQSVDAVIGRTDWDKAHTLSISRSVSYWHNDETLRPPFYNGQWEWEVCQKHRIFISQAHYPIKGVHMLLKALPAVIDNHPDTEVYIAGHDFFNNRGMKISGYGHFINRMIRKLHLKKHIHFTGLLSAEEMKQQYLQAQIFVCPSAIENSPNSVGEAQMLGTPVIAAYVGGIPSMVIHKETGLLYRFEEPEHLAAHIMSLFEDEELCQILSQAGRSAAATRHNPERNANALVEIYESITNMNGNGI
jgi:glycosyltransferase involved in cell wall biosynthesis